jgi:23S rRNA pseudouridine2605 synthase
MDKKRTSRDGEIPFQKFRKEENKKSYKSSGEEPKKKFRKSNRDSEDSENTFKGKRQGHRKGNSFRGNRNERPGRAFEKDIYKQDPPEITEEMRLNRYLSNAGVCSRREADQLIKDGLIKVNGEVVTEMGSRVKPGDQVEYEGKQLKSEKKVYLLLNKPRDFVTTMDDPNARKTVMDLVGKACTERIYPVGRLDRNTTGVLLFTNDGDLATRLTHPKYKKRKIYQVQLDRKITKDELQQIADGIELEDGPIAADDISFSSADDKKQVGIEIHSGKNRIVRRIFEHMGYKVVKLDRVYFAGLTKKNLPRGKWRFLSEKEVSFLRMGGGN